jgi:hypothetical protein
MKQLVKLLLVIFVVSASYPAYSQLGLKAGVNFATQYMEDEDGEVISDEFSNLTGFHVGIIASMPLGENFAFETGLLLNTRGTRIEASETFMGETIGVEQRVNLYYIDLPLTLRVGFGDPDFNVFGKAGAYVGYGLWGRISSEFTFLGETESEEVDIEWGTGDDDHYRPLDWGLTAGVGVEVRGVRLSLNYDFGIANIAPDTEAGIIQNRVFRVSLAYMFGRGY